MLGLGQVEGAAVAGREGLPRLRGGGRLRLRRRLRDARVGAAAPRALLREGKAEASAAAGWWWWVARRWGVARRRNPSQPPAAPSLPLRQAGGTGDGGDLLICRSVFQPLEGEGGNRPSGVKTPRRGCRAHRSGGGCVCEVGGGTGWGNSCSETGSRTCPSTRHPLARA